MIGYDRRGGHSGRDQALNSPWDLAMLGGKLYLAMAGLHQIWVFDPTTGEAHVVAGTGRENITDGPARRAALAQPSGIAAAGEMLYFADSETSAVRSFDPHAETITTLVGEGLFTFGDADGPGARARLQHPLGVAATPDALYVADSYNHRIKRIDLRDGAVHGVVGQGTPARLVDTALAFSEPGGLSVAGHDLFIADTNNDRVIHFDLQTGAWREIIPNLGGQPLAEAA
jgi:DNA-binding beta-propeller fold protein YncE